MKEYIHISYCTNISLQSITTASWSAPSLSCLKWSWLALWGTLVSSTSAALSLKESLFSLTCNSCCWVVWAPEPSVYFLCPYPIPFPTLLCSDFFPCPRLLLKKSVMALQSQRKKKQRSSPNAFSFFQFRLHECVCVCTYSVFVTHHILTTSDGAEAKYTKTAITCMAPATPCRGRRLWHSAWAPSCLYCSTLPLVLNSHTETFSGTMTLCLVTCSVLQSQYLQKT